MATKGYMKLDHDWHEDPKVLDFQARYGKAALVDLLDLYCVCSEFFGSVSLADPAQLLKLQRVLGKKGKALDAFLSKVASCGLIDGAALEELGRIGSERSIRDGTTRRNRRTYALEASAAAAEKRRAGSSVPGAP